MRGARRGFTITELLVVVAILVLMAAAVLPVIGPMRRQSRLRAGAAEVAAAVRAARSLAIARSAACYVYTDFAASVAPDEVQLYLATSRFPEAVGRLPEGVVLAAPVPVNGSVWFGPDGSPSSAFSITVSDAQGGRYRVSVSPGSGQVGVSRVKP